MGVREVVLATATSRIVAFEGKQFRKRQREREGAEEQRQQESGRVAAPPCCV